MIELGIPLGVGGEYPQLTEADRYRHLFLIGETGTGKTTLLLNLLKQELNKGIIILDPHGDLANRIASIVPEDRLIYVDKTHPLCLNPMDKPYLSRSEIAKEFITVVNAVVETASPDQMPLTVLMQQIITKAVKAFNDDEMSISYLGDFLEDKNERAKKKADYPYWKRFDDVPRNQRNEAAESAKRVSARLSLFYENDELLPFIEGKNKLDIQSIAENQKVVVFNFAGFDDETTAFIGGIISTAIKSYWQHIASVKSAPLYFYADEYHLFITKEFERFLTDTRKYNISLTFSGHSLKQVKPALAQMMLSCYAIIILSIGRADADILADTVRVKVDDILDLPKYEAFVSISKQAQRVMCFPPLDIQEYVPDEPEHKSSKKAKQYNFLKNTWINA